MAVLLLVKVKVRSLSVGSPTFLFVCCCIHYLGASTPADALGAKCNCYDSR